MIVVITEGSCFYIFRHYAGKVELLDPSGNWLRYSEGDLIKEPSALRNQPEA